MTPRARRAAVAALTLALSAPSAAAAGPRVMVGAGVAADPARDAAWQQFFAGLPHGRELDSLTVVLSSPADVTGRCGRGADGCYSGLLRQIVLPGLGGPGVSFVADVARHEYGHHLAAQSDNAPFDDWLGTKRWFTRERICARMRRGELADGASSPYELSPAEGFAEAFRVAAGGSRHDWIVDEALFPDLAARHAILADASHPWAGGRERRFSGRLSRRQPTRRFVLRVPLDGTVRAVVTGSGSLRPALTLSGGGRELARGSGLRYVACGHRALRLTVRARRGSGRFRVTAVVP